MGFRIVRLETQGLLIASGRLVQHALLLTHDTEVQVGFDMVRGDFYSLLMTGHGLVEPAEFLQDQPHVRECRGIVGRESQGLLQAGQRVHRLVLCLESAAEIVVGTGIVRLQSHRAPKAGHGLIELARAPAGRCRDCNGPRNNSGSRPGPCV